MWTVEIDLSVEKIIIKLDKSVRSKIIKYLTNLELLKNPKSFGKQLLHNKKGFWRYRVGDYRIICKIKQTELIVLVVYIGHRNDIYDK